VEMILYSSRKKGYPDIRNMKLW